MADVRVEFVLLDDMTIQKRIKTTHNNTQSYWRENILSRTFNFAAGEVITVSELTAKYTSYPLQISTNMTTQNFSDCGRTDEIAAAHAELVRQGGKPPALEDVLRGHPQHHLKQKRIGE